MPKQVRIILSDDGKIDLNIARVKEAIRTSNYINSLQYFGQHNASSTNSRPNQMESLLETLSKSIHELKINLSSSRSPSNVNKHKLE